MINANIWIRNPYPFRYEERISIQETLRRIYGCNPYYLKESSLEWISVDNINKTTAKNMADTIKAFHLQAALRDKSNGYYRSSDAPALNVEVEIRAQTDGRPDWAKEEVQP